MTIQFNTDKNIEGHEAIAKLYTKEISNDLSRFSDHITRVEVHLSDENAQKTGPKDKRCVLEVRVGSLRPIAVTNQDGSLDQAVKGAITKMKASLDTVLGRLNEH